MIPAYEMRQRVRQLAYLGDPRKVRLHVERDFGQRVPLHLCEAAVAERNAPIKGRAYMAVEVECGDCGADLDLKNTTGFCRPCDLAREREARRYEQQYAFDAKVKAQAERIAAKQALAAAAAARRSVAAVERMRRRRERENDIKAARNAARAARAEKVARKFRREPQLANVEQINPLLRIGRHAADVFGVSLDDLTGPSSRKIHCRPRQAAWLVAHRVGRWSSPQIAARFQRMDHTTVLAGIKRAESVARVEPAYASQLAELERRVLADRLIVPDPIFAGIEKAVRA